MIDAERWAEIRRLRRVEKLSVRQISRRMSMDRKTVRRALRQSQFPGRSPTKRERPSKLDAYHDHIRRYLTESPDLSAVQVLDRLKTDHAYAGEVTIVRDYVRTLREQAARAFLRLTHLPGECAQVDWAYLGTVKVGRSNRRVSAFVMVLAHSRLMYVEVTLSERLDAFLEAHVRAFDYFGGVPKRLLYDNCKTVVVQRVGGEVRFHPRLHELAGHYLFKPRVCPPRRPWHKGVVESGIGYLRKSYQRGRGAIEDFEREQRDLATWRDTIANYRDHTVTRRRPRDLFEEAERAALLKLPERPYDASVVLPSVSSSKFFRVHFDGAAYSVPHVLASRRGLVLKWTTTTVEIYSGGERVARHRRTYARGEDVLDPEHDRELRAQRRRADRDHRGERFLTVFGEEGERYVAGLARAQVRATHHVRRILDLADRYGDQDVRVALHAALSSEAFGADYVENLLHQERRRRLAGPIASPPLLRDEELARISVPEPDLNRFDHLFSKGASDVRQQGEAPEAACARAEQ